MKRAVLTMEVEDWYHLDYIDRTRADCAYSLLDGLDQFAEILETHKIPATFFVLGELAAGLGPRLQSLDSYGHEIASHGWRHTRPSQLSLPDFVADARRAKTAIEDIIGHPVDGYRAPCFDLGPQRRDRLPAAGYAYDNSLIFWRQPTPQVIDQLKLHEEQPGMYSANGLRIFEVSTTDLLGRKFPISSAGYFRLLPWLLMERTFRAYLATASLYVLSIHPFELSCRAVPKLPRGTHWRNKLRLQMGRGRMKARLESLIDRLQQSGFAFSTFSAVMSERRCCDERPASPPSADENPVLLHEPNS